MVKMRKVYDEHPFAGEFSDLPSLTVQSEYIPISQQVKMIMRGEITVPNEVYDVADEVDLDTPIEEEFFEDATDVGTIYQDDIAQALKAGVATPVKPASNSSEHKQSNLTTAEGVSVASDDQKSVID